MQPAAKLRRFSLLKLELRSQPKMLCVLRGALEPLVEDLGFSPEDGRAVVRAVDEAVSNIMRHCYCGREDKQIIVHCRRLQRVANGTTEQGVEILLLDSGPPVDPTKLKARPLDEIRPGGLGLHIIRGSVDTVDYRRGGGRNCLRLVKYVRPPHSGPS